MKTTGYILLLWVFAISSCTPEPLDIDIPQLPQKPVVASQYYFDTLTQQSAVVITLSKTLSATDSRKPAIDSNGFIIDNDLLISGAIVELITASSVYECQEGEKGIYYAMNVSLQDYEHCSIRIKDASGALLLESATESMPEVDFTEVYVSTERSEKYVNYTLTDDTDKRDWYVVNYFTKQQKDSTGNYNDPAYVAKRLTEQKLDFDLYTDKDFVNGTLSRKRRLGPTDFDTIAVAVSSITEGYYNFLSTQKRYGMLINQIKGEVINFPTNINGGYGYFSLNKPRVNILVLED